MKKVLRYLSFGLAISILNILVTVAQPTLDFARKIGSSTSDKGVSIGVDGSDNIFMTGTFTGSNLEFNPGGTSKLLSANGGTFSDFYIGKYNSSGVLTAAADVF